MASTHTHAHTRTHARAHTRTYMPMAAKYNRPWPTITSSYTYVTSSYTYVTSSYTYVTSSYTYVTYTYMPMAAKYNRPWPTSHGDKTKDTVFHQSCKLSTLSVRVVSCCQCKLARETRGVGLRE